MRDIMWDAIRNQLDIVNVINDDRPLDKHLIKNEKGDYQGDCLFCFNEDHKCDTTHFTELPLRISKRNGVFFCFKCHKSGDAVTYIAQSKKISPVESIQYIEKKYNIKIENKPESVVF